jgi:hypothetical protein
VWSIQSIWIDRSIDSRSWGLRYDAAVMALPLQVWRQDMVMYLGWWRENWCMICGWRVHGCRGDGRWSMDSKIEGEKREWECVCVSDDNTKRARWEVLKAEKWFVFIYHRKILWYFHRLSRLLTSDKHTWIRITCYVAHRN